jgi:hypothetical protein
MGIPLLYALQNGSSALRADFLIVRKLFFLEDEQLNELGLYSFL